MILHLCFERKYDWITAELQEYNRKENLLSHCQCYIPAFISTQWSKHTENRVNWEVNKISDSLDELIIFGEHVLRI